MKQSNIECLRMRPVWRVRRFPDAEAHRLGLAQAVEDPITGLMLPAEQEVQGNLLLNEGIAALLNLLTGAAETAFSLANSYLGVGDSTTAAAATQTGLQASTNKFYAAATSVTISGQTVTWEADFQTGEANFAWNEVTVANGSSDTASNLNRKVTSLGTKATGIWTLSLDITVS